jgi:hypothetical protein
VPEGGHREDAGVGAVAEEEEEDRGLAGEAGLNAGGWFALGALVTADGGG